MSSSSQGSTDQDSDHRRSGSDSDCDSEFLERVGKSGGKSSPMRMKDLRHAPSTSSSASTSKTNNNSQNSAVSMNGSMSSVVSPTKRPGPKSKTCPSIIQNQGQGQSSSSKGHSASASTSSSTRPSHSQGRQPQRQPQRQLQLSSESESASESDSDGGPKLFNSRMRALQNKANLEMKTRESQSHKSGSGVQKGGQKRGRSTSGSGSSSGQSEDDSLWLPARNAVKNRKPNYVEESTTESDSESDRRVKKKAAAPVVDNALKIHRVMDGRIGKVGATGEKTVFYVVEDFGDPNETLPKDTPTERQFLIKWAGQSDLHNTWESEQTIQKLKATTGNRGFADKVVNFMRKEDEWSHWKKTADPEEVEYEECQREMEKELTKSYNKAERIIAEDILDDKSVEYFVKWECLPYEEATWETGGIISKYFPQILSIFKKQLKSNCIPSKSKDFKANPPTFTQAKTQPEYMKGLDKTLILRNYQMDGVNWMVHAWCRNKSVILGDEMGLGKTIQAICFLTQLFEVHGCYGPFLLVVPLSTMSAWQKEFRLWAPQLNVLTYLGNEKSRAIIREHEWLVSGTQNIKFNALLTTYETIVRDAWFLMKRSWAVTIVDEAHRLKNRESGWHTTLAQFKSKHIVLMTGTPIQNSLEELWSLLHFIMPHKFDDWESFEKTHSLTSGSDYRRLHAILEPYILRRVKKDVEKSLPLKHEKILRVEMTGYQRQIYKWVLTKNYAALKKEGGGSRQSFLNVCMQLRKCCNHALLCKPADNRFQPNAKGDAVIQELLGGSGKLTLLDKLLVRLKEKGHRVLIFSQFVIMLDIIEELLQLRRFAFQRLDGKITGERRLQGLNHFNAANSKDFCYLLSTRAGGLGINLASANTVIIFDSDWNPQNDLQAQARAHRIGQTRQVNVYRFVTKNTVEESIVERAKTKMVLDHLVIQRMDTTGRTVLGGPRGGAAGSKVKGPTDIAKDELNAILKFGAEQLFNDKDKGEGGQGGGKGEEFVCDVDEILRVADTETPSGDAAEGDTPLPPGDELLSAFKVVSFANDAKDWDEIIPEGLRGKWEEEEKERVRMEQLTLQRSSRKGRKKNYIPKNSPAKKKRKRGQRKGSEGEDVEDDDDDFEPESVQDLVSSDSESEGGGDEGEDRVKGGRKERGERGALTLNGLTEEEVKRFVGSLKKFSTPLMRMDVIGKDAELDLTKHSEEQLIALAQHIIKISQDNVERMEREKQQNKEKIKEDPLGAGTSVEGKKKRITPRKTTSLFPVRPFLRYKMNGTSFLRCMKTLEPLGCAIPLDESVRKEWRLELHGIQPPYDVEWGDGDDTQLLLGVWEFGFCTDWSLDKVLCNEKGLEAILDKYPGLKAKVFREGTQKPQFIDLVNRVLQLLLVIRQRHMSPQLMTLEQAQGLKKTYGRKSVGGGGVGTKTVEQIQEELRLDQGPLLDFTQEEVGRFLESLKNFPMTMNRLKEVRGRDQFEHKTEKELRALGQHIILKANEAKGNAEMRRAERMASFEAGLTPKRPNTVKRVSLMLKGNSLCARTLLNKLEEWEGLAKLLTFRGKKIEGWRLSPGIINPPNWPNVPWGIEEDSRLLLGVWDNGLSNLQEIRRRDPLMSTRIDFQEDGVSEIRIQVRVQTLLTAIKRHLANKALPKGGRFGLMNGNAVPSGSRGPRPGPKSKKLATAPIQNGILPSGPMGNQNQVKKRGRPLGPPRPPRGPRGRPRKQGEIDPSNPQTPESPGMSVSDEEELLRTEFPELGMKKLRVHMERMNEEQVSKYFPLDTEPESPRSDEIPSPETPEIIECSGENKEKEEEVIEVEDDDDELEILVVPPPVDPLLDIKPIILISSDEEDND